MATVAASVALLLLLGLAVFQVALVLGAPLGEYAWGGGHAQLPRRLRVASASSIALYLLFAAFVSTKAGIATFVDDERVLAVGMWVFTVYFFAGIALNALSRSRRERMLMTPVAAVLAVSFLVVTLS